MIDAYSFFYFLFKQISQVIEFPFPSFIFFFVLFLGMDQTQEGISYGLSWMYLSYWMAMDQAMA